LNARHRRGEHALLESNDMALSALATLNSTAR
jgi:hypothetical protein